MRFVQFRLLGDVKQATRIGIIRTDNGKVVDLTNSLPECHNLVQALTKLGIQGVTDAAKIGIR